MEVDNVRRAKIWIGTTLGVSAIIIGFLAYSGRETQWDDALIYYRYLRNALAGSGLVYNEGERFNALTSPLFTVVSLVFAYVVRDIHLSQVLLCSILLFLTTVMVGVLLKGTVPTPIVALPPLLIASNSFFYNSTGFETSLFCFLILVMFHLYHREKMMLLGICAGLLLLTRAESVFLIAVFLWEYYRRHRALPSLRVFIIPVLLIATNLAFNLIYYGNLLPQSFAAKIAQGRSGLWASQFWEYWPNFVRTRFHVQAFFGNSYPLFMTLATLALIGVIGHAKTMLVRNSLRFLAFYTLFYVVLGIPHYFWYYSVYYLFGYIAVALGLSKVYELTRKVRGSAALVTVALFVLVATQLAYSYDRLRHVRPYDGYRRIGLWIKENTDRGATVSCVEIGLLGWYSERIIIDPLGLVTPLNAGFLGERRFDEWLEHYQPDYFLVHDTLWPHESSARALIERGLYEPTPGFEFPTYTLLRRRQ